MTINQRDLDILMLEAQAAVDEITAEYMQAYTGGRDSLPVQAEANPTDQPDVVPA